VNTPVTIRGWLYPSVIEAWRAEAPPRLTIERVYRRYNELGWDLERAITQCVRAKRYEQMELEL
jgi:hypothetical protein